MKTFIKQLTATIIITAIGYALIVGAINSASLTIDNPHTHFIVSIGLSIWLGALNIWLLSRVLTSLREKPESSISYDDIVFTEQELTTRDSQQTEDFCQRNSERIAEKFGPLGELTSTPKDFS